MFSIKGDTVLDPFLGSGTTMKAAIHNMRNCIGYEAEKSLLPIITKKTADESASIKIIKR
jgi:DNA modification methylase